MRLIDMTVKKKLNVYRFKCPNEKGYKSIYQSVKAHTKKDAVALLRKRRIKIYPSTGRKK